MRIQNGSLVWKNNSRKEPKLMAKYSWRISKMYLESDRFGDVCVQQFDRILIKLLSLQSVFINLCSLQIWWSGLKLKIVDWLIFYYAWNLDNFANVHQRRRNRGGGRLGGSFFAKLDITPWFFFFLLVKCRFLISLTPATTFNLLQTPLYLQSVLFLPNFFIDSLIKKT